MTEVTVADFEKNFDAYLDRIEGGEEFLIRQPDGKAVVAMPVGELEHLADEVGEEEWYNMFNNHDDAS
ncbi:Phd-like antitoxin [Synechococcus phage S-WAM2]|jgi:PHD/YefM family antitoxin component YafN of YafNO toxin-antitoxin module|uniref:PhDYefM tox-ant domain containing protein n=1 Tax=Synechococcus phage S-WAM2 TaxID=1815522 RepID=A0A1D8KTC6_9CAUD|nr:Phd-like antitoxin [Synechococcus phage S-WAM2]AOV61881.1 PhDYefM tox-ant domain containing protein [Synechococcus phage S-WAM2]